ncbi:MAG: hypothetical protein IT160_16635 [Bryobacterales bacterium]|nr:hypothetical protein [Bryobacterales bacterium]
MKRLWDFIRDAWCYVMHPDPMWPVNGMYRCPSCQRQYPVPWEAGNTHWNHPRQALAEAPALRAAYLAEVPPGAEVGGVRSMRRLLSVH